MLSISEKINEYLEDPGYPFHMPGHKRQGGLCPQGAEDFTEIDGFDNLYQAQGIIAESERRAAQLFGADQTLYLVNGSTVGIQTAILAAAQGGSVLVGPDCHKSVYNALKLGNITGISADGEPADGREALSTIGALSDALGWDALPSRIERTLQSRKVSAVVIVSPSYEGIVSDVQRIARIAHEHGALLIVDEAHGAHFGMHPYFPENSNRLGADIVIHSMHKTLTGLTQTALLHVNGDHADRAQIAHFLEMLQTSSPSYVLMKSMDACVALLNEKGSELFEAYVERLKRFRAQADELENIRLFETEYFDRGKIVLTADTDIEAVYAALRDRHHIQLEMAGGDYALAMTSFADTDEGFDRLLAALKEIDRGGATGGSAVRKADCYQNHA